MTEHYRCCTKPMHVRAYCVIRPFPVHTFQSRYCLNCEEFFADPRNWLEDKVCWLIGPFLWRGHGHLHKDTVLEASAFRAKPGQAGEYL